MAAGSLRILVVEDDLEVRTYLEMAIRCLGYRAELAQDGNEALDRLAAGADEIAAVLLDLTMPEWEGNDTLHEIRRRYPDHPVIVISGSPSPLNIVSAMKSGATDFLCKPITHEDLQKAITAALKDETMTRLQPVKSALSTTRAMLGRSPQMAAIQAILPQVGWSEAPVLIQGETGSGKEMLARDLHANSARSKKAFLKLNCAALPPELVESELFGYERGAFTGAFQRKPGMFELADGGTILLDEIGDMDVRLQAKLLQVLQDHEFQRIGGKDTIKVDVRVIAATHRDLERAIAENQFREDLYYRLNVINMHVPPLRERKEDIIALAEFLMKKHAKPGVSLPKITPELRMAMLSWEWPGNVRELENFARKFLIFQDAEAAARELRERITRKPIAGVPVVRAAHREGAEVRTMPILEQVTKAKQKAEADAILEVLNTTRWNRKQAAMLLKIDYKALLYKMKKLGIDDKPTVDSDETQPAVMRVEAS